MRKNSHGKILRWEPKEQYLSTVLKSCPYVKTQFPLHCVCVFQIIIIIMANPFFITHISHNIQSSCFENK